MPFHNASERSLTLARQRVGVKCCGGWGSSRLELVDRSTCITRSRGNENPIAVARAAAGHIGHVQFADDPGRHEPGTGTLDWSAILHELDSAGSDDWIGLEDKPTDPASRDLVSSRHSAARSQGRPLSRRDRQPTDNGGNLKWAIFPDSV